MSSVLQTLFGGSTQNTSSQSTQSNYTNPELQSLASPLASTLTSLLTSLNPTANNAGNGATASTPVPQAPVTGQEQSLLNQLPGETGPGTASSQYISSVLNGNYLPGGANANPALAATITAAQRPTLDNLNTTLSQALPGQFAMAGQSIAPNTGAGNGGSSAFDNAAALAYQSAANTSTDIASNIANNEYNTGVQQQSTAASLDQNEVNNTISALTASALPRLIQQNGIDEGLSQFNTQIQALLSALGTIGQVQAPTLAANSTSTGSATSSKGIIPDLFKPV